MRQKAAGTVQEGAQERNVIIYKEICKALKEMNKS